VGAVSAGFGWTKTAAGLRKTKLRGRAKAGGGVRDEPAHARLFSRLCRALAKTAAGCSYFWLAKAT
jgi:hypothetical protein